MRATVCCTGGEGAAEGGEGHGGAGDRGGAQEGGVAHRQGPARPDRRCRGVALVLSLTLEAVSGPRPEAFFWPHPPSGHRIGTEVRVCVSCVIQKAPAQNVTAFRKAGARSDTSCCKTTGKMTMRYLCLTPVRHCLLRTGRRAAVGGGAAAPEAPGGGAGGAPEPSRGPGAGAVGVNAFLNYKGLRTHLAIGSVHCASCACGQENQGACKPTRSRAGIRDPRLATQHTVNIANDALG